MTRPAVGIGQIVTSYLAGRAFSGFTGGLANHLVVGDGLEDWHGSSFLSFQVFPYKDPSVDLNH